MGTFNANILPASTGLSLGNSLQAWNGTFSVLTLLGLYQTVGFAATVAFAPTNQTTIFDLTLTGNVTASTLAGVKGMLVFILRQDATGSRTFAWPANVFGGTAIGSTASQVTVQAFAFDGTNAYPIGAAGIYP